FLYSIATHPFSALSLHDALPICLGRADAAGGAGVAAPQGGRRPARREERTRDLRVRQRYAEEAQDVRGAGSDPRRSADTADGERSEEHTSELQSRENLVCRLLLE